MTDHGAEHVFGEIYDTDHWDGGSGVGSAPDATVAYRRVLQTLIRAADVRSVVDVGCGDWQLGSLVDWSPVTYVGLDVVASVVERNAHRFARRGVTFAVADGRRDALPDADLLLVKDVLQHWPTADVRAFLDEQLPRYRYVLVTNDIASVHWSGGVNEDIQLGAWRTLDVEAPPFSYRASWRRDIDVRGQWTKRLALFASRSARLNSWRRSNALRLLRRG